MESEGCEKDYDTHVHTIDEEDTLCSGRKERSQAHLLLLIATEEKTLSSQIL